MTEPTHARAQVYAALDDVHAVLDNAGVPLADAATCDDAACVSQVGHRVRTLAQAYKDACEDYTMACADWDALKAELVATQQQLRAMMEVRGE